MRSQRPDPEVRRLMLQLSLVWPAARALGAEAKAGDPATLGLVRRQWQLAVKAFAFRKPVSMVTTHEIPGRDGPIRLRAYRPAGIGPFPVLVWFHGGGFVFGDLYTAGATCRALANHSGAIVIAVDYRLAPEHPLDAGYADCLDAVRWITKHASDIGGDPDRVAVGGDSAGGGYAALIAQECARREIPLISQVLVYPATDVTGSFQSALAPMQGLLTQDWIDWLRREISQVSDLSDPRWSAVSESDLAAVAPAIVLTAGFDPLRDEGIAYVQALKGAGVPVRHLHYPGQIHGFVVFDRVFAGGRDALRRLGGHLAQSWLGDLSAGAELDLPPGRHVDQLVWLAPKQRWHEVKVAALIVRDRLAPVLGRRTIRRTSTMSDRTGRSR